MKKSMDLIVDVNKIGTVLKPVNINLDIDWLKNILNNCEYPINAESVKSVLNASYDNDVVTIKGNIFFNGETDCSICLSNTSININVEIDIALKKQTDKINTEIKNEFTSDDLEFEYFNGNLIELSEIISDEILLALPLDPRCPGNCKSIPYLIPADEPSKEISSINPVTD
ncbi:MAG: DUF177 domain-containing protein [Deltaproteobacteria bacterium]|nr:DUF177 domain-containing protein [Deltaproteobacteria bacterium]